MLKRHKDSKNKVSKIKKKYKKYKKKFKNSNKVKKFQTSSDSHLLQKLQPPPVIF